MLVLSNRDGVIIEQLETLLADVEGRLAEELISDLPCVNDLVTHVERYRGKMLRPTLVLVAGMAGAGDDNKLADPHCVIATVTEMVHLATLVHDDVLDEARIRRGGKTINHLNGNETAVMLGDYLISHAYHLCSSLASTTTSQMIAETTNTICEGELLQLANRNNLALDERTYFEIIRRKTASLCGTCCRLGVLLTGASEELADDLYRYGENLGIAYQIVDDLLDLVGSENTVGKTLRSDLHKGKLTLPIIQFLQTAPPSQRDLMTELIRKPAQTLHDAPARDNGSPPPTPDDVPERIQKLLVDHDSVIYANQWATKLVDQAKACLNRLPESPARVFLHEMADAVLTRKF